MRLTVQEYKQYEKTLQDVFGLNKAAVINNGKFCYFTLFDLKKLNKYRNKDSSDPQIQGIIDQIPTEFDQRHFHQGKPITKPKEWGLLGLLTKTGLILHKTVTETIESQKEYNKEKSNATATKAREIDEASGAIMQPARRAAQETASRISGELGEAKDAIMQPARRNEDDKIPKNEKSKFKNPKH